MTDDTHQRDTTSSRPDVLDGVSRRQLLKASGVGAAGLALGAAASPGAAQDEEGGDGEPTDAIEDFRIPQLNTETLEAELDGEPLEATAYEDWREGSTTYVGEVAGVPGLFVGVSLIEETEGGEAADQPAEQQQLMVYLCAGEIGARPQAGIHLVGEYDTGGVTLTHEDVEATVALVEGEVLGVATLPDVGRVPFVAVEGAGDADVYKAESEEQTDDDDSLTIRWVVLPDGRQRGHLDAFPGSQWVSVPGNEWSTPGDFTT